MGGFVKSFTREEPPRQQQQEVQREAVKEEPKGPTRAEMDDDVRRGIKRRGRRATILTSLEDVDQDLTLGQKTLLGG